MTPLLIGIDGRSGAGKTTLAVELAALLREHHSVSVFHLEDIYPGWDGLREGMERYVADVLTPLSQGSEASWACWDWESGCPGGLRTTVAADLVIVEGVGAACSAARSLLDVVIWVDAAETLRHSSALRRDGETYAPHWDRWAGQESAWLEEDHPAEHADMRVLGHQGEDTPQQVWRALSDLPQCESVLSMERARRRGLTVAVKRLPGCPDPATLFERLYGDAPAAVWLDSSDAPVSDAVVPAVVSAPGAPDARNRFTIMADDSGRFGQRAYHRQGLTTVESGAVSIRIAGPFFRWLDRVWGRRAVRTPASYPCGFTLGWLGFLGYALKRETGGTEDTPGWIPDTALLFAGRAVVLDHQAGCSFLLTLEDGEADVGRSHWLDQARAALLEARTPAPGRPPGRPPVFTVRDTRESYLTKIRQAQQEIVDGNSYEVCLTTQLDAVVDAGVDAFAIYCALRTSSPAPFAHFMRFPGFQLASTSPERFLKVDAEGILRAEPIKGTRRRAGEPGADAELIRALRESPKDRAENIMIVDLLRNDLSHHAVPGSVTVSRLCDIETYATVHQMVSTIDARLRPGASRAGAIAAAFPAGSMTGAPKISTMAILERLEQRPRGVYAGAAGYLSLSGAADLAVVIRTLVIEQSDDGPARLSLGLGGAITADSCPAEEWEEVRTKSRGVLAGLGAVFPPEDPPARRLC